MILDENLIEEIVKTVKTGGDLSIQKKVRALSPIVNLISELATLPKKRASYFDFSRVRNQILNRIAVPKEAQVETKSWMPKFFGIGVGVMGSLMIVVSLTLGTAVAALQSVPGSTIYPLKKVVENFQLRLASDDQKIVLQVQFAETRAEEIQAVLDKQEQGQLSTQEAQKIVSATVQDLQKTAAAAASSAAKQPNVANKLADLTTKLKAASIQTEGDVKIEIEKAVKSTKISQEEAIKNIENAGIKVEETLINIEDNVTASGKITAVTTTSLNIGTARFLLTTETKYEGITLKELKEGQVVDITGEIKDNKTYALTVTLVSEAKEAQTKKPTETPDTPPTTENQ